MLTFNLHASKADRWMTCAAYPAFSHDIPPPDKSEAAREGEAAMWVAEQIINKGVNPADMNGKAHPNGWFVTPDICEHAADFAAIVRSHSDTIDPVAEYPITFGQGVTGRIDAMVIHGDTLFIDKFAFGYQIAEAQTATMMIYAAAVIPTNVNKVQLGVYQPRAYDPRGHYRPVTISRAELEQEAATIFAASKACHSPEPVAVPSENCVKCPGAHRCQAVAETIYKAFEVVRSPVQSDMPPDALARELEFLNLAENLIKARKTAVDAEAEARMNSGETVPGWTVEPRFGNRVINIDLQQFEKYRGHDPEIVAMFTKLDVDLVKALLDVELFDKKPKSPAALERAGLPKEHMASITKTPLIGKKLTPLKVRLDPAKFTK